MKLGKSKLKEATSGTQQKGGLTNTQIATLIDSLWRDGLKLYNEKEPATFRKRNTISPDIVSGVAIGQDNQVNGNESVVIGIGGITEAFREILMGSYPSASSGTGPRSATEWNALDLLFAMGNGTDKDNRSNALEVYKSGLIKLFNSLLIGEYAHGAVPPTNGMLQYTALNGLEIWEVDKWVSFRKHNSRTEKQGGSVELDEFYHLTQAQINDLHKPLTIAAGSAGKASIDVNQVLTINDIPPATSFTLTVNNGTITSLPEGLVLTWDDIANVPVADASSVANWNTFFDLPTNGTPFSSVVLDGNTVKLIGGNDITLKDYLFLGLGEPRYNLISIIDSGCVTHAGEYSLHCIVLTTVDLPALITAGFDCFDSCYALTSLNLPSLTYADEYAFAYCTALTSISLPALITAGNDCFYGCTNVVSVNLPELVTAGDWCFAECLLVNLFYLPVLDTAGEGCFYNLTVITSINLPSLRIAGDNCFYYNNSILSFVLPKLITAGNGCFSYCSAVVFLNLPLLTTAGSDCFRNSYLIDTILIPNLITAGIRCFYSCVSIPSFSLPNLTTAGNSCFGNCYFATSYNLPLLTNVGLLFFEIAHSSELAGYGWAETVSYSIPSCNTFGGVANAGAFSAYNYLTSLPIQGRTVTLTIPAHFMTDNAGNPVQDIQYLQANNIETIITV